MVSLGMSSCAINQHIPKDKRLLRSNQIRIESDYKIPNKKDLEAELVLASYPKANRRLLNLFPVRLSLYYWGEASKKAAADSTSKGFFIWLGKKLGEKPVYINEMKLGENAQSLHNRLFDKGYFVNEPNFEIKPAKRKNRRLANVIYTIKLDKRYSIRQITLPQENTELARIIREHEKESLLQKFKGFDAAKLKMEKDRVSRLLKNNGYFDFRPDFYSFEIDSFTRNHIVDIKCSLDYQDTIQLQKYYIRDIYIMPDYQQGISSGVNKDTIHVEEKVSVVAANRRFKHYALIKQLKIKSGKLYSLADYETTIKQYMELGVFKFVNIKYEKVGNQLLDCRIYLSPSLRMSWTSEIEINNKFNSTLSTNNLGIAGTLGYKNKNLFKAAELLSTNLFLGAEFNISDTASIINTLDLNAKVSVLFPYLFPFNKKVNSGKFNRPLTVLSGGTNFIKRIDSYTVNSSELSYGYEWRTSMGRRHLPSVFISFFNVNKTTPNFDIILAGNPRLRKSFEEIFLNGLSYSYVYSNQPHTQKKFFRYFKTSVEQVGTLVNLLDGAIDSHKPFTLFGINYSQYTRGDIDLRYYYNLTSRYVIVSRFYAGMGIPYGNSKVLPFIKQFFAGGTNDIRSFRIRGIGPGSYLATGASDNWDRTGDIKLLFSSEFRFPLFDYIKGATFIDMGNIWTIREGTLPGSSFSVKRFWKEIGIGTGAGLRLDFSYFVLRFDTGIALKWPYKDEDGFYWSLQKSNFFTKSWRKENVRFNLGIGYPF